MVMAKQIWQVYQVRGLKEIEPQNGSIVSCLLLYLSSFFQLLFWIFPSVLQIEWF